MQTNEAISVLKNLSYKPGWRFDAESLATLAHEAGEGETELGRAVMGPRFDTTIAFRLDFDTVDTDREYAREGYPQPKELGQTIPLNSDDFQSADELVYAVFELIMQLEVHEAREFFRRKDCDYAAPFHPHRPEGNALWEKCVEAN